MKETYRFVRDILAFHGAVNYENFCPFENDFYVSKFMIGNVLFIDMQQNCIQLHKLINRKNYIVQIVEQAYGRITSIYFFFLP